MIKFFFKWLLRLIFLAVALAMILAVTFLLTYNSILRLVIEHNIRAQTGMETEIGRVHFALTEPTIEIRDLKIFNPTNFAGTPFLNFSEIHIEYDRDALAKKQIHFTLLRLNLAELDIVKNQFGQTNIFALANLPPEISAPQKMAARPNPQNANALVKQKPAFPANPPPAVSQNKLTPKINFKKLTDFEFSGIDTLNVSVGKVAFVDLENSRNNCEQNIDLKNCVVPHVKSGADLAGLALLIDLRSNHFFDSLLGSNVKAAKSPALQNVLNLFDPTF